MANKLLSNGEIDGASADKTTYNQGISFLSKVELIFKRSMPKIKIHSRKIRLSSKRRKRKAFIKILIKLRMKFSFYTYQIMN